MRCCGNESVGEEKILQKNAGEPYDRRVDAVGVEAPPETGIVHAGKRGGRRWVRYQLVHGKVIAKTSPRVIP